MKSSNIYQKLKSAGAFGKKEEGPKLNVGVKSPLNMKKPSPTKIAPVVAAVGKKVLAGAAKKAIGAVASKVGDKVGEKITGGSPAEMSHKKGHSAAKMAKKSPMKMAKKSPSKMAKKSPAKMAKKSPAKKALVGKQKNLPDHLKAKILAAPGKMKKSAMKMSDKKQSVSQIKKAAGLKGVNVVQKPKEQLSKMKNKK